MANGYRIDPTRLADVLDRLEADFLRAHGEREEQARAVAGLQATVRQLWQIVIFAAQAAIGLLTAYIVEALR